MNKKPNILLVLVDQQRYDCIGRSNIFPVRTPNIDKLAEEGMWFNNAYTPIPLCCPARQSILNGRRPEAFGAHWNYDITLKIPALEPTEYTWTKELKENGYKMAYIGKWHVNPVHKPLEYGFDYYFGEEDYDNWRKENYPEVTYPNGWLGEADPIPLEQSRTHFMAKLAIDKMKEYTEEGTPWNIRLDFPEPHLPCRPAGKFADMYKAGEVPMWGSFIDDFTNKPYIQKQQLLTWDAEKYTWEDWAPIVARYYGIISQVDDAIGRVIQALEDLNQAEDTLIIYTSDHGDMCGGHRMIDKHYVMYEDIVKVPLLVKWSGEIEKGAVCERFVYNCLDLQPTLLEILGLEPKEFFHGRSMLPLLKGEPVDDWRSEVVSTYNGQQFGLYNQRMIRNAEWKYIWNPTDIDELYDMNNDPHELHNLISEPECHEVVASLRRKLFEILDKDGDELVKSPWMRNQLLNNKKLGTREGISDE